MEAKRGSATPPQHDHERLDARPRPIAIFQLALLLLVAVSMALMGAMFHYFTQRESGLDTSRSPLAEERELPPEPRLQISPTLDLVKIRAREEGQLNGYGWVDQEQQLVRIPIDRAIDIIAERGLPVRESKNQR